MGNTHDIPVQCTRCRNKHMESERKAIAKGDGVSNLVCPRCSCKSYYDLQPQVAWCWASGLIEFGDEGSAPDGSMVIAHGPKSGLTSVVSAVARQGLGESAGKLLVPGVPEAENQAAAFGALVKWLGWCSKGNGKKGRYDVIFETERRRQ